MENKLKVWLARDEDGGLFAFSNIPLKKRNIWSPSTGINIMQLKSDKFPSIKWEDDEPTEAYITLAKPQEQPRQEQRDWSKFNPNKPKFDPKTLQPFDKVLVRDKDLVRWRCTFYSHLREDNETMYKYVTAYNIYKYCIPYNDDTKHLVGTTDEAPEYYRYWED